jgi:predicted phosphodiesterase
MHLGRQPGLPDVVLLASELGPKELSVRPVWEETVAQARSLKVAAVLLAGDVVDSDDGFMAAYQPLAAGVRKLVEAGISVIAVSGNHDTEVLPRLAKEIPELHLLGKGGEWDSKVILVEGEPVLRVMGWSFPQNRVTSDPLESLPASMRSGSFADGLDLPVVGLLHGDLDVSESHYAPLSSVRLAAVETVGWLLGHQHKPSALTEERPIGYLGCLAANDFGEPGLRGPWLGTLEDGRLRMKQLPLSRLRLEEVEVDVTGVTSKSDVEHCLTQAARALEERRGEQGCSAQVIMLRPTLVGRSSLHRTERDKALAAARAGESLFTSGGGAFYFLDQKSHDLVRPEYDLHELGCGSDPPAVLAQLILGLEEQSDEYDALVERTLRRLQAEAAHKNFSGLDSKELELAHARRYLIEGGLRALEDLMAQKEVSATGGVA